MNITLFTVQGVGGDCIPNGLTTGALLAPRGLMKAVHGRCALFTKKTSYLEKRGNGGLR